MASDLTPEQVKAYRLADNKVGELAEWDWNLLPAEMDGLTGFDMTEFGFDEIEAVDVDSLLDCGDGGNGEKSPLNALSADLCLRYSMKICAYVQEQYAKTAYKKECLDTRQFAGLKVIIDSLERTGHSVEYAGIATVHEYDIVLVSLTSDCDWWTFVKERVRWRKGNYKVIVGGAGVLHVTPFLRWFDFAVIGRGEHIMTPLIDGIERDGGYDHESVIDVRTFSPDKIYRVAQTDCMYPHRIQLTDKKEYIERAIGCNHKCFSAAIHGSENSYRPWATYTKCPAACLTVWKIRNAPCLT